jgi:hypothetical protein
VYKAVWSSLRLKGLDLEGPVLGEVAMERSVTEGEDFEKVFGGEVFACSEGFRAHVQSQKEIEEIWRAT